MSLSDRPERAQTDRVNNAAFSYYSRLSRVRRYVLSNYSKRISLADAAGVAAMEKKYFSVFFHSKTGICFSEWLRRIRVNQAMEILRSRNHSITDVAYDVGFQDLRTFERAFKRCTGQTARAFKRATRPD